MSGNVETIIKDTFIELLEDHPLSEITVKEIVSRANINRNSFYYHYQDLPSLIESIVTDQTEIIFSQYRDLNSLEECLEAAIEFALANRKLAMHLYNSSNRDIFDHYLMQISDHVIRNFAEKLWRERNVSEADKEILIKYYKCLIFGLIIDWMSTGMDSDILSNFRRLMEIYSGIHEEIINRVSNLD